MFVLKTYSKFFVKEILGIPKLDNLLMSFGTILEQKWVEILRESINNYGKGLSMAQTSLHGSLSTLNFL